MFNYIHYGNDRLIREEWVELKNICFVKPEGGIWASKYTPGEQYLSEWYKYCELDSSEENSPAVTFNLKDDAKIYTIDSLEDLIILMNKYKLETPFDFLNFLDFEKIAKDYDVIELTNNGQEKTRFSRPNLYGWDVECILILNFDVIKEQKTLINQSY